MANPWCTAPFDVALTPFNKTVNEIDERNRIRGRTQTKSKSAFIAQLRDVDVWLERKRRLDFQRRAFQPDLKQALEVESITTAFEKMVSDLDSFVKSDALKNSFINAFRTSQIIWDDISQENKAKLVYSIRLALSEIMKIVQIKMITFEDFKNHEKNLKVLIERTNVFDIEKEFDDYYLEDLYDLLTECSNSLELIRISLSSNNNNNYL